MPSIKLSYFDIEGPAEKVRLTLAVTDTTFEDYRISREEWPALKETMPFGQVPYMEVTEDDGNKLSFAQSAAMMRWVARKFDKTGTLYPADANASIDIEQMIGLSDDMQRTWVPAQYMGMGLHKKFGHPEEFPQKPEVVKALRETFLAEELPKYMNFLTKTLEKTGAFLCGANITIADLQWLAQLRYFTKGVADHVPADSLDKYPVVVAWMSRCYEVPQIKKWYNM